MTVTTPKRPQVRIAALTANTIEVFILTEAGEARLVCGDEIINIDARGLTVEVRP